MYRIIWCVVAFAIMASSTVAVENGAKETDKNQAVAYNQQTGM